MQSTEQGSELKQVRLNRWERELDEGVGTVTLPRWV